MHELDVNRADIVITSLRFGYYKLWFCYYKYDEVTHQNSFTYFDNINKIILSMYVLI